MFDIDLTSRTPIYEQLYKKVVELIMKGILQTNAQLPSVRSLAKELGVNPNTVAKAYSQLEHDGVIYSFSGRGSFVAKISHSDLREFAFEDFDRAVAEALDSSVTKDELIERIRNFERRTAND